MHDRGTKVMRDRGQMGENTHPDGLAWAASTCPYTYSAKN